MPGIVRRCVMGDFERFKESIATQFLALSRRQPLAATGLYLIQFIQWRKPDSAIPGSSRSGPRAAHPHVRAPRPAADSCECGRRIQDFLPATVVARGSAAFSPCDGDGWVSTRCLQLINTGRRRVSSRVHDERGPVP